MDIYQIRLEALDIMLQLTTVCGGCSTEEFIASSAMIERYITEGDLPIAVEGEAA